MLQHVNRQHIIEVGVRKAWILLALIFLHSFMLPFGVNTESHLARQRCVLVHTFLSDVLGLHF